MKKEIKVPGLSGVTPILKEATKDIKHGYMVRITAAKQVAAQLIADCITDKKLADILTLPATTEDVFGRAYKILGNEMPQLNLLEQILLLSIEELQNYPTTKIARGLVRVTKRALEDIGYQPGTRYEKEFESIFLATRGSLNINPGNKTTRTDIWEFLFNYEERVL